MVSGPLQSFGMASVKTDYSLNKWWDWTSDEIEHTREFDRTVIDASLSSCSHNNTLSHNQPTDFLHLKQLLIVPVASAIIMVVFLLELSPVFHRPCNWAALQGTRQKKENPCHDLHNLHLLNNCNCPTETDKRNRMRHSLWIWFENIYTNQNHRYTGPMGFTWFTYCCPSIQFARSCSYNQLTLDFAQIDFKKKIQPIIMLTVRLMQVPRSCQCMLMSDYKEERGEIPEVKFCIIL